MLAVEDVGLPGGVGDCGAGGGIGVGVVSGGGSVVGALVELEHEGLVDAVLGVFARVDAVFDEAVAPGARAEAVADPLGGFFEDGVAVLRNVVHGDAAGDQGPFVEEFADGFDGFVEGGAEGMVPAEAFGWALGDFWGVWLDGGDCATGWGLDVGCGYVAGGVLLEFDAGGLVEFVAVWLVGGHEAGWRYEVADVRGAWPVVDGHVFEHVVVWLHGVDGEFSHHGVVAGDHLEIGQVAEAMGFVDRADWGDIVVSFIVFEAL